MDVFARKTNSKFMIRGKAALTLTKYPSAFRKLVPGLAYAAKNPPTKFVPLNTTDYFGYTKSLSRPETITQNDVVKVSSTNPNMQIGFGLVNEDSDEDLSFTSSEKVDPSVLNAFANPNFKTNTTQIVPQKRKIKEELTVLKNEPKAKKQKFATKLKFSK
jgi:hypothetical protein